MAENIKNEVVETEVIIEEKKGPVAWIKDKVAKIPRSVKYVAAGLAGAGATVAAGAIMLGRAEKSDLDDGDQLVIEDFTGAADPTIDVPDEAVA